MKKKLYLITDGFPYGEGEYGILLVIIAWYMWYVNIFYNVVLVVCD